MDNMSPRAIATPNPMESKPPTTIVTERLESTGADDGGDSPQLVRPVSSLASSPRLQAQRRWPNAPASPKHVTRCADISVDEIVTPLMNCGAGVVSAFETFKANCQKSPLRNSGDASETRGATNSPFAGMNVPVHIERLAAGSEEACVHIADNIQARLGTARRASDGIIDMACGLTNNRVGGSKATGTRQNNSSPTHGSRLRRGPSDNGLGVPAFVATSQSFVYTMGDAANLARDFDNNSFQSKNSALTLDTAAQEDLEYDLYRLQRMTSWATLGTGGTIGTGGTTQTGGTNDTMSTEVNADDDGREIPAELQKIRRRRTRRRRVVKFEYPPISALKEYPRSDPRDREFLFFTEDELDQLEDDRMSTTTADDVEIVAVPASYEDDDAKQQSSKKKASQSDIDESGQSPTPRNALDRSDSLGATARGLGSPNSSYGELGPVGSSTSPSASTPSPLPSMEDRPSPRQHHRQGKVAFGASPPPSPVCTESGSTAGGSIPSPHGGGAKGSWRSPKRGIRRAPTPGPTPRLSASSSSSSIRSDQATNPNSPAAIASDNGFTKGSRGWGRRKSSRNKNSSRGENDNKSTSSAPADVDVSPRGADAVGMVITTQANLSPEPSPKSAPSTPLDTREDGAGLEEGEFDEEVNDIPKAGARKEDGGAPLSPFDQQKLRRRASFNGRAGSSLGQPPNFPESARSDTGAVAVTSRLDRPMLKGVQIYMRQRSLG